MFVLLQSISFLIVDNLAAQNPEDVQVKTIVSLYKTREAIVGRLGKDNSGRPEAARDRDEARLFAAYLDGRIYHYCRQRYLSLGMPGLEGLPCPLYSTGSDEAAGFAPVPENGGATRAEKVMKLDQELDSALGRFDAMLLKEEEKVAAHIPRQQESGGTASDGGMQGSVPGQSGAEEAGGSETTGAPGRGKNMEDAALDKPEGSADGRMEKSQLPPIAGRRDLEEGDDDIVARQLREAAEQETDPEVQERLWEEYRKYKEGIR